MRISDWSSDVCSSDLRRNRHPDLDVLGVFPLRCLRPLRIKSFTLRPSGSWFVCGSSHRNRPLATTTRSESPYALPAMPPLVNASGSSSLRSSFRSEEHTSELQSLMRISYAVFCLKQKQKRKMTRTNCIE